MASNIEAGHAILPAKKRDHKLSNHEKVLYFAYDFKPMSFHLIKLEKIPQIIISSVYVGLINEFDWFGL